MNYNKLEKLKTVPITHQPLHKLINHNFSPIEFIEWGKIRAKKLKKKVKLKKKQKHSRKDAIEK